MLSSPSSSSPSSSVSDTRLHCSSMNISRVSQSSSLPTVTVAPPSTQHASAFPALQAQSQTLLPLVYSEEELDVLNNILFSSPPSFLLAPVFKEINGLRSSQSGNSSMPNQAQMQSQSQTSSPILNSCIDDILSEAVSSDDLNNTLAQLTASLLPQNNSSSRKGSRIRPSPYSASSVSITPNLDVQWTTINIQLKEILSWNGSFYFDFSIPANTLRQAERHKVKSASLQSSGRHVTSQIQLYQVYKKIYIVVSEPHLIQGDKCIFTLVLSINRLISGEMVKCRKTLIGEFIFSRNNVMVHSTDPLKRHYFQTQIIRIQPF